MARTVSSKAGKRKPKSQEVEFRAVWSPRTARTKVKEFIKDGPDGPSSPVKPVKRETPSSRISSLSSPSKSRSKINRINSIVQQDPIDDFGDNGELFDMEQETPWTDAPKFGQGKVRKITETKH
jgi:hypothetical protein